MTADTHAVASAWQRRARIPRAPRGPYPLLAAIVLAWAVLFIMLLPVGGYGPGAMGSMSMPGMPGMGRASGVRDTSRVASMPQLPHVPGMGNLAPRISLGSRSMVAGSLLARLTMWELMVAAMMLPGLLPAVRHVSHNSLCWRRRRATTTFVSAYLAIWLAFGLVVVLTTPAWSSIRGAVAPALALALAALWQLTPYKRAALSDCHRAVPLPPRGRPATVGVVRFGARNGLACLRSCWAMMLAMTTATSGGLVWMIVLASIALGEKRSLRPQRATRRAATALAAGSIVVSLTGLLA